MNDPRDRLTCSIAAGYFLWFLEKKDRFLHRRQQRPGGEGELCRVVELS